MEVNNDDEITAYYRKKNIPAILGDKYFKESAVQRAQLSLQEGHPPIYSKPSADLIAHQIGLIFDMTPYELTAKNIGERRLNLARKLAIYSCQQLGDMKLKDIAFYFNLASGVVASGIIASINSLPQFLTLKSENTLHQAAF